MKKSSVIIFLITTFILMAGSYTLITDDFWWKQVTPVVYLLPPFACTISGLYVLKFHGFKKGSLSSHHLIILGLFLWFLAEVFWATFDYLDMNFSPSIADFFYIIAYIPLFFGFVKEIKHSKATLTLKKIALSLPLLAILCFITIYYGIIGSYDPTVSVLERGIALFYGIGDLLLSVVAVITLITVLEYRGGKIFFQWLYLLIGVTLFLFADILYIIYYAPYMEGLWPYRAMDLLWGLAYLFFTYGLFSMGSVTKEIQERVRSFKV